MKLEKQFIYLLLTTTGIFSFFFSYFVINPSLHYHYQQISWHSGMVFFQQFLNYAGGPSEYLALFVSQFFYSNFQGSLIVAVSGFLISFFILKTIRLQQKYIKLSFLLIPLVQIIFLALLGDYKYYFSITLNVLIVSLSTYLCTKWENMKNAFFPGYTIFAGICLYFISGGIYFLIFMFLMLLLKFQKPFQKWLVPASILLLISLLLPFLSYKYFFLSSLNMSFFHSAPNVAVMLRYGHPLLFYVALAIVPFLFLVSTLSTIVPFMTEVNQAALKNNPTDTQKHNERSNLLAIRDKSKIFFLIQMIFFFTLSFFILKTTYQPEEKAKIEIDYFACKGDWDKVISLSGKMGNYNRMVNFQYNRAIAHQGKMLEKLFDYKQILGSQGLFLDRPFTGEVALPNSDIHFDLGNIDESQRYAFEAQTLMPTSPRVLKRLILNCIILEKPEAARTYMNVLSCNSLQKDWVEKYINYIDKPGLAASESTIAKKRKDKSKAEGIYVNPRTKLVNLLKQNPKNKVAFEYLIAFDLMEHDLSSLLEDMEFMQEFNYKKIPTVLEEAVVLFRSQRRNIDVLNKIRISSETRERFKQFASLTNANKGDKEKAKQATLMFKNTYWYYVLFESPFVTNLKLETRPVDVNY